MPAKPVVPGSSESAAAVMYMRGKDPLDLDSRQSVVATVRHKLKRAGFEKFGYVMVLLLFFLYQSLSVSMYVCFCMFGSLSVVHCFQLFLNGSSELEAAFRAHDATGCGCVERRRIPAVW